MEIKKLTNQKFLRDTLHEFKFYTKKNLGQNFLVDEFVLDKIIEISDISKSDEVLEIGPGPGVLTQRLVEIGAEVLALEIDEKVIPILEYTTGNPKNLTILNQNAVQFYPEKGGFILCANIPYYLTSPLLKHYLGGKNKPKRVIFLMQKEVAQRICCKDTDFSILALQVKIFGEPTNVLKVEKEKFFPSPKVDSAILKIEVFDKPKIPEKLLPIFWDLTHFLFGQKRKKISNTLSKYREMGKNNAENLLEKSGIDGERRAQTISISEWKTLIEVFLKEFGE